MTRTSYIPTFLTPLSLNHQKLRTRLTTISSESDEDISEPNPHERPCPTSSQPKQCSKSCSSSSVRRYNKKKWEDQFPWLEYSEESSGAFYKECKKRGKSLLLENWEVHG